jgi:hypothetical protein
MTSRILSGIIAVVHLVTAYMMFSGETAFIIGIFLILPVGCIWFSEAMGDYIGFGGMDGPAITRITPGWVVAFGGWLLLLLPVVIWLIVGVAGIR